MVNVMIGIVLAAIVGVAIWYVVKTKKSGRKCIGCPEGNCPYRNGSSQCSCGNH